MGEEEEKRKERLDGHKRNSNASFRRRVQFG